MESYEEQPTEDRQQQNARPSDATDDAFSTMHKPQTCDQAKADRETNSTRRGANTPVRDEVVDCVRNAQHLTRHKISCREPSVHATKHTAPTADTGSVNVRLARGQLHRLVRCFRRAWSDPTETQ